MVHTCGGFLRFGMSQSQLAPTKGIHTERLDAPSSSQLLLAQAKAQPAHAPFDPSHRENGAAAANRSA